MMAYKRSQFLWPCATSKQKTHQPLKFPDKYFCFRLDLVEEFTEIVPSEFTSTKFNLKPKHSSGNLKGWWVFCLDVAQGHKNLASNETQTHLCKFASLAC